jgi:hypothetical protein
VRLVRTSVPIWLSFIECIDHGQVRWVNEVRE